MNQNEIGKIETRKPDFTTDSFKNSLKFSCISNSHSLAIHAFKSGKHNFVLSYSHFPSPHV